MVHSFELHADSGGARVSGTVPETPLVRVISSVDHSEDHSTVDTAQGIDSFIGITRLVALILLMLFMN